jgi:hypothetical protein
MVSWDKTKAQTGGGNRKDIERLQIPIGDVKIRLVGEVHPRYVYWVTTNEGKKMPVECLGFDREEEVMKDSLKDPMKEVSPEIFSEKPQFAYVCNVIDRASKSIKIFDLRATIYGQIVDYAANPEYGNPSDETKGYDLTIKKEKTGPKPQNVKYTVIPSRSSIALTAEDKELELFELDKIYKRQTYAEQKEWLLKNTAYFAGEVSDEFVAETAGDLD